MLEPGGGAYGLRTEISGELAAALAAVVEATGGGRRRYDAGVCRTLVQTIAARAYGRPLLELAFLLGAADRLGGRTGYVGYFWGRSAATAAAFKAASLGVPEAPGVTAEVAELVLHGAIPEFRISYSRVPFLAALLDFCVTALGFEAVDGEIALYLTGRRGREDAQTLANALSRRLYEFLKQHLPSQQYERKFKTICAFLGERSGRRPSAEAIDDRTILAFWEQRCAQHGSGGDFRGFRTVAIDCFRLREALKGAETRRAIEQAVPIGPARDAGEVDPEQVRDALEAIDGERSVLAELFRPPAAHLKSVNKREAARLELVLEAGDGVQTLPLTILRAEIFGTHQARIIQAMRRQDPVAGESAVALLIDATPEENYEVALSAYSALSQQLRKTRKALMYILFRNRKPEALTIAFALFPDLAPTLKSGLPGIEGGAENVVPLHPEQAIGKLIERALTGDPEQLPEAGLYRTARIAFTKVNRRGFEEARVFDPEIVEAAEASEPLVRDCGQRLQDFLKALGRNFDLIAPEQVFAEDCRRFRAALSALYREPA